MGDVHDTDDAKAIALDYADEECVGEPGEVIDVTHEGGDWIVEFRTHTFSDAYEHRVRISRVGNLFKHERTTRLE